MVNAQVSECHLLIVLRYRFQIIAYLNPEKKKRRICPLDEFFVRSKVVKFEQPIAYLSYIYLIIHVIGQVMQ